MVLLVAEIGVNWRTIYDAKQMIDFAQYCGANAVKFQAYSEKEIKDSPIKEFLASIQMTPELAERLAFCAHEKGLKFGCTPMYPEAVDWLAPCVDFWKVWHLRLSLTLTS